MRTDTTLAPPAEQPFVLVVDDDQDDVDLVRRAVEKSNVGCSALALDSGMNAVSYLEALVRDGRRLPSLILLDVALPGMSGLEVLKSLRRRPELEAIPVIVMTSCGPNEFPFEIDDFRSASFRRKPVDAESIASAVTKT
jgi:CheY-like chemotaxis protein